MLLTTTGQWMQEDPNTFDAGDSNLRRYVGNDPTNMVDSSGLIGMSAKGIEDLEGEEARSHYPPDAFRTGLKIVAIISDNTNGTYPDTYKWASPVTLEKDVSTPAKFIERLDKYGNNSIDVLIVSGHHALPEGDSVRCGVASNTEILINQSFAPDSPLFKKIREKVKSDGRIIIAACCAASAYNRDQQTLANKLQRTVYATRTTCRCDRPEYPFGGYADTVAKDDEVENEADNRPWIVKRPE
jgi:hypothetical protein